MKRSGIMSCESFDTINSKICTFKITGKYECLINWWWQVQGWELSAKTGRVCSSSTALRGWLTPPEHTRLWWPMIMKIKFATPSLWAAQIQSALSQTKDVTVLVSSSLDLMAWAPILDSPITWASSGINPCLAAPNSSKCIRKMRNEY